MHKKLIVFLIISLTGILFLHCNQPEFNAKKTTKIQTAWQGDSFDKTVWKGYSYDRYFLDKTWMTNIDKGFDSIYIRLWYHDADTASLQVIEFKKPLLEDWSCAYSVIEFDSSNVDVRSFKRVLLSKQPKSGWNIFVRKLFELNITNLRSEENIPNYESMTDGNSVHVEIANDTGYRVYALKYLRANPHIIDAMNMAAIIKLIAEEFNIRPYSEI
jgi:hypothetical protein